MAVLGCLVPSGVTTRPFGGAARLPQSMSVGMIRADHVTNISELINKNSDLGGQASSPHVFYVRYIQH